MEVVLLEPCLNIKYDGEPSMPARRPSTFPTIDLDVSDHDENDDVAVLPSRRRPSATRFHSYNAQSSEEKLTDQRPKASKFKSDSILEKPVRRPTIHLEKKGSEIGSTNGLKRKPPIRTLSSSKNSSLALFTNLGMLSQQSLWDWADDDSCEGTSSVVDDAASCSHLVRTQSPRGVETIPQSLTLKRERTDDTFGSLSSAFFSGY